MADRCPAGCERRPLLTGEVVGAGAHQQASRSAPRHRDNERRDDFDIRQEWWTGDALPDAKIGEPQTSRGPKVEAVGLPQEKGEGTF